MENCLVIGASGGIGAALCRNLRDRGARVTALSRRETGFDLGDPAAAEAALAALEPGFDAVFIASGILTATRETPEKTLRDLTAAEMQAQFMVNTIGPALVLRHMARLLPRDRRAVVGALSARVGSIGDNRAGGWYAYRASKAALNQVVHSAAIELARSHPRAICVALHPGTVDTPFTRRFSGYEKTAPEAAAQNLLQVIGALTPQDTGGFFDWAGKRVEW